MARRSPFRNYIYVSAGKIAGMSFPLKVKPGGYLTELKVAVGSVSAGVNLDRADREGIEATLPSVERALRKTFKVKKWDDPKLQVGDWFEAPNASMGYGILDLHEDKDPAVVFTSQADDLSVLLIGSAFNLIGSNAHMERIWRHSYPHAVAGLIRDFSSTRLHGNYGPSLYLFGSYRDQNSTYSDQEVAFRLHRMYRMEGGLQPVAFIANALRITERVGRRTVIGSPLFVAAESSRR